MASSEARRRARVAALCLSLAPLAAGAATSGLGGTGCTDLIGQPKNFDVSWQDDIKPLFNELYGGRCTSCHNAGQLDGGLDLTDAGPLDAIYKIVPSYAIPGDPRMSVLIDKLTCDDPGWGGMQMPFAQNPLTAEQQGLIWDWIEQGALGQGEKDGPIARDFIFRDGAESLRF